MPRFSRGSSRVRPISTRRLTEWDEGPGGVTVTDLTTTVPSFVGSVIVASLPGVTIIRIRGELMVHLRLVTAANDGCRGAFGIGIASAAAVAVGIGSVPTPITEQGADSWMYWKAFSLALPQIGTGASTGLASLETVSMRVEVDSKAMRKLPQDLNLYAAVELGEITGTIACQVSFDSRILGKLP